jgi:hypothetical protein
MEVDLRMEEVAREGIDPERGQAPRRTMSMQRDLRMAREGIDPERGKAPRRTMSMQTKIRSG